MIKGFLFQGCEVIQQSQKGFSNKGNEFTNMGKLRKK